MIAKITRIYVYCVLPDFQSHAHVPLISKKMAANVPQNGGNYIPAHASGVGGAVGVGEGHNPEQVSFIIV